MIILTIMSCGADQKRGCHDAIRETYIKSWGWMIDYKFIMGRDGQVTRNDEIVLDLDDGYEAVYQKYNAACSFAHRWGSPHWFLCDTDTYVHIPRLLRAGKGSEYMGHRCAEGHACGGHGIWFGRRAMEYLRAHPAGSNHFDLHVGMALQQAGIPLDGDARFLGAMPHTWADGGITAHLGKGTGTYKPEWMREAHARL